MSLNSRKNEDILNDLHSAEGRHNSSEIINLETEIKTNNIKQKVHYTNMKERIKEANKKKWIEEDELKKTLFKEASITNILDQFTLQPWGKEHLQKKFWEIQDFYGEWIQVIEITKWDKKDIVEKLKTYMSKHIDINTENEAKIQGNFDALVTICQTIADGGPWHPKATNEHDFALITPDGAMHIINDIDTGYYILPQKLIENWDVASLAEPIKVTVNGKEEEKMARWGKPIKFEKTPWEDTANYLKEETELLKFWENVPLSKIAG